MAPPTGAPEDEMVLIPLQRRTLLLDSPHQLQMSQPLRQLVQLGWFQTSWEKSQLPLLKQLRRSGQFRAELHLLKQPLLSLQSYLQQEQKQQQLSQLTCQPFLLNQPQQHLTLTRTLKTKERRLTNSCRHPAAELEPEPIVPITWAPLAPAGPRPQYEQQSSRCASASNLCSPSSRCSADPRSVSNQYPANSCRGAC
jgi:hypothetical protein